MRCPGLQAYPLSPSLQVGEQSVAAETRAELGAGEVAEWNLSLPAAGLGPGRWPGYCPASR